MYSSKPGKSAFDAISLLERENGKNPRQKIITDTRPEQYNTK